MSNALQMTIRRVPRDTLSEDYNILGPRVTSCPHDAPTCVALAITHSASLCANTKIKIPYQDCAAYENIEMTRVSYREILKLTRLVLSSIFLGGPKIVFSSYGSEET